MNIVITLAALGLAAAGLSACSSDDAAGPGSGDATVSVVASTDVWGSVAAAVAGDLATDGTVSITSLITDPAADPHSYEADVRNQLAVKKAQVVIENGGGYDDFMSTMIGSSGNSDATVIDAVDVSGVTAPSGGELNEHVWYDLPGVRRVAAAIESALSSADPADAGTFAANAKAFDASLTALERTEASIKRAHGGTGVAITEPVPLYLLQACGLVNKTPAAFSEAVEEGTDVSPLVLQQTEELFGQHQVRLLAYNEQTTGAETEAVLDAARSAGVAVVPVTETLPDGQDYLGWMRSNLDAVSQALS